MDFNYDDESKPYSSDDAYEDLEKIRDILHEAQRKINKEKLKESDIDLSIQINIESEENTLKQQTYRIIFIKNQLIWAIIY